MAVLGTGLNLTGQPSSTGLPLSEDLRVALFQWHGVHGQARIVSGCHSVLDFIVTKHLVGIPSIGCVIVQVVILSITVSSIPSLQNLFFVFSIDTTGANGRICESVSGSKVEVNIPAGHGHKV